jgi:hypothetical protein
MQHEELGDIQDRGYCLVRAEHFLYHLGLSFKNYFYNVPLHFTVAHCFFTLFCQYVLILQLLIQ